MRRDFVLGFVLSLLAFVALNVVWLHVRSDCGLPAWLGVSGCADDIRRAGFPLQFYQAGGFVARTSFSPLALLVDGGMAVAVSAAAGWVAQARASRHA